jgi:hypothetical protein
MSIEKYTYTVETRRRPALKGRMRTWRRYSVKSADGREVIVSRWRSEKTKLATVIGKDTRIPEGPPTP